MGMLGLILPRSQQPPTSNNSQQWVNDTGRPVNELSADKTDI
jgi:hypothetical protein